RGERAQHRVRDAGGLEPVLERPEAVEVAPLEQGPVVAREDDHHRVAAELVLVPDVVRVDGRPGADHRRLARVEAQPRQPSGERERHHDRSREHPGRVPPHDLGPPRGETPHRDRVNGRRRPHQGPKSRRSRAYVQARNRWTPRTTASLRTEWSTSKACWAPGSSTYTTGFVETAASPPANARTASTATSESAAPCTTMKGGAPGPTRSSGDARAYTSGASTSLRLITNRSRRPPKPSGPRPAKRRVRS